MRFTFLFLCLFWFPSQYLFSQKFKVQYIEKRLILVDEEKGLFANKYETSNIEYAFFLRSLNKKNLQIAQYDSSLWSSKFPWSYNVPITKNYHNHKAFYYYPVVNISQEGAEMFCQWLTKKYNAYKKRKFKKVIFRLPTEAEWLQIAKYSPNESPYATASGAFSDEFGTYEMNFKMMELDHLSYDMDGYIYTAPIHHFPANNQGFFNLSGNAAEMTAIKDISMGGHWDAFPEECELQSRTEFVYPDPRVGFRIVMELVE